MPQEFESSSSEDSIQFAGPFRLESLLGSGGFGSVWHGVQEHPFFQEAAVKIPLREDFENHPEQTVERLMAEIQCLAYLNHPNVVHFYQGGMLEDGRPFLAMEKIDGVSIKNYCEENHLSISERIELFLEVCDGVEYVHDHGVLHGDIKPENLIVDESGGAPRVKLIDFGVAKFCANDGEPNVKPDSWAGTEKYSSPESYGDPNSDFETSSDVYSLGKVLCELVFGFVPTDPKEKALSTQFEEISRQEDDSHFFTTGESFNTLKSALSGEWEEFISLAIHNKSEYRISSVPEFADELRNLKGQLTKKKKRSGNNHILWWSATGIAAAIVIGIVYLNFFSREIVSAAAAPPQKPPLQLFKENLQKSRKLLYQGDLSRAITGTEKLLQETDWTEFADEKNRKYARFQARAFLAFCHVESGQLGEGAEILDQDIDALEKWISEAKGLENPKSVSNSLLANMLMIRGDVSRFKGNPNTAIKNYSRSVALVDSIASVDHWAILGWIDIYGAPHVRLADTLLRPGALVISSGAVELRKKKQKRARTPLELYNSAIHIIGKIDHTNADYLIALAKMKSSVVWDDADRPEKVTARLSEAKQLMANARKSDSIENRFLDLFLENKIPQDFGLNDIESKRLTHRISEIEWWLLRANTLMQTNRPDEALASYRISEKLAKEAIKLAPTAEGVHFYCARVFRQIAEQCATIPTQRKYAEQMAYSGLTHLDRLLKNSPHYYWWEPDIHETKSLLTSIRSGDVETDSGADVSDIVRKP